MSSGEGHAAEESCVSPAERCLDSPPPYLRWARNLPSLLEDPEGVELFRRYLEQEGRPHADTLDFWFACEGLKKQQDPDHVSQLVKVIHKRFFLKSQLPVAEALRKEVARRMREARDDVFEVVQPEVERLITETTYPNFLRSELYLAHVAGELSPGSAGSCPSGGVLPTLHEDAELGSSDALPLTRDMLIATQKRRALELRPRPEAYAGVYLQHAHHPYHSSHPPLYSSYNPVSRQDSELQSLSSDARTESDNMSLTDSSVDGMSAGRTRVARRQHVRHCKQMKESASLNRDPHMHHTVIPRTQRLLKEQVQPMAPGDFAAILIEKLENVRREQDAQDKLERRLQEGDLVMDETVTTEPSGTRSLADAIREKLLVEDDSDQAILDQHVSRVWSDLTPSQGSPRPRSPEGRRRPSHCPRHARKDKDVFSTFSSDSGNVHDFPEGSEHRLHLPKSRSVPDYQGRGKKTLTELTDSGVSVVSDSAPCKDSRVLTWLLESDTKPRSPRHGRGSLEHPAQPFVADPSMPPLPRPHTATQLEEARRRLEEEGRSRAGRKGLGPSSAPLSGQSTLRKTGRGPRAEYTTVVFSFCDEKVPYRTKIPGRAVTLRTFKEYLPKKGSYRYFFKTECEDVDTRVIQEEVMDDNEVLPLWEGKIMAQVKPVE